MFSIICIFIPSSNRAQSLLMQRQRMSYCGDVYLFYTTARFFGNVLETSQHEELQGCCSLANVKLNISSCFFCISSFIHIGRKTLSDQFCCCELIETSDATFLVNYSLDKVSLGFESLEKHAVFQQN